MKMYRLFLLGLCAWTVGCQVSSDTADTDDMSVSTDGEVTLGDASRLGPDGAVVEPDGAIVEPDGAVVPDDAAVPDAEVTVTVDSCEDACARYEACGRLDELLGGQAACISRCERLTRGDDEPSAWWGCTEVESCNLIHLCPVPEPAALTCEEICTASDSCGVGVPNCLSTCEAGEEAFAECGERIYDGCNVDGFLNCVGEQVFPGCVASCDLAVGCNLVRADGCVLDCIGGLGDPDPLFSLRTLQRNQCLSRTGDDCFAADACINPSLPGQAPVATFQQACQAWDACNFFGGKLPCREFLREGDDPSIYSCVTAGLRGGCAADPFRLVEDCRQGGGGGERQSHCSRFCEAQQICGVLEDGPGVRQMCLSNCTAQNGDPDEVERFDATLVCVAADRCPDLEDCLANSGPGIECREHCALLDGCGIAPEACVEQCDADWARDRQAAFRDCAAQAAECGDIADCVSPVPPCEAYCEAAAECGIEQAVGCVERCDDTHFGRPDAELLRMACVIGAAECRDEDTEAHQATACAARPNDGRPCLHFCRAQAECDPHADLSECLQQCGDGFEGDDGVRFLVARDCLGRLDTGAECAEVSACIPGELEVDCPAYCDRAAGCGVELAECEAACENDPLSQLRTLQNEGCLAAAGDDCGAVRECLVPEIIPIETPGDAVVDQVAFCLAYDRCGIENFIGLRCDDILQEFGGDADRIIRCMQPMLSPVCPRDPEAIFQCFEGGEPPPVNPLNGPCADLCETRALCGDPAGADQGACRTACTQQIDLNNPDDAVRLSPQMSCRQAWSCDTLQTCLEGATPEALCAEHCGRLNACDLGGAFEVCVAECDQNFARSRELDYHRQVELAADCGEVQAAARAPGIPCDDVCATLEQCELAAGGARCVAQCDDAHFADPLAETLEAACLLSADGCEAAQACLLDPGEGARLCASYCKAVTECADEPELGLIECMTGCVAGFGDDNGLRFAAAEACLSEVEGDACGALTACLPDALAPDCAAHCGALDACALPTEGCVEACAEALDPNVAGCVADTVRVGAGCGQTAECVGFEPPPPSANCVAGCQKRAECDPTVDQFLCRLTCTPEPPALPVQLACADASRCGEAIDACFELPADLDAGCVAACEGTEPCGDVQACAQRCTGQIRSGRVEEDRAQLVGACLQAAIEGEQCNPIAAEVCFQVGVELPRLRAFGHHGNCETFNGCNDGLTCANAACTFFGHGPALSFEEGLCSDLHEQRPGMDCSLFNQIPNVLDENWRGGGGCNIPVVYDVVCQP